MKKLTMIICSLILSALLLPGVASAFDLPLGNKGLDTGVVAPKGFNAITEMQYYYGWKTGADGKYLKDVNGNKLYQQMFVIDEVLEWNSGLKFLGATWSADAIIPLIVINGTNADGSRFAVSGLADIYLEPVILGWSTPYVDSKFIFGMNLPTGTPEVTFNHFSASFTGAFTISFNKEKTVRLSLMPAFEVYSKNIRNDKTEGSDFILKWGLGYTFKDIHTLGVIGYSAVKIQNDKGKVSDLLKAGEQHVSAVGLQYSVFIPQIKSALSFLANYEFAAANMPMGIRGHVVFVKMF